MSSLSFGLIARLYISFFFTADSLVLQKTVAIIFRGNMQ